MEDKLLMKKGEYDDANMRISHQNPLWYLFRMLTEETEVPNGISSNVMRCIGGITNDTE